MKAPMMWNSGLRVLPAIRQLLLSFAILGLLLAPMAGSAHGAMQQNQVIGMADHSPCCPESPVDNCPKCALMTSCALFCVDDLAMEQSVAMVGWLDAAPVAASSSQTLAGVDHPPPRKPPRCWIFCPPTGGRGAARNQARSPPKFMTMSLQVNTAS
jgi:hypothetical protein